MKVSVFLLGSRNCLRREKRRGGKNQDSEEEEEKSTNEMKRSGHRETSKTRRWGSGRAEVKGAHPGRERWTLSSKRREKCPIYLLFNIDFCNTELLKNPDGRSAGGGGEETLGRNFAAKVSKEMKQPQVPCKRGVE